MRSAQYFDTMHRAYQLVTGARQCALDFFHRCRSGGQEHAPFSTRQRCAPNQKSNEAICPVDLCHKYILYLYLYLYFCPNNCLSIVRFIDGGDYVVIRTGAETDSAVPQCTRVHTPAGFATTTLVGTTLTRDVVAMWESMPLCGRNGRVAPPSSSNPKEVST
jgi:hypothetical protein